MKNILYIGVVVVIAVLALLFFKKKPTPPTNIETQSPQTQTQSLAQPSAENTITYTDQGFSPATLTIKSGTTVTFVNQNSGRMWVASNPHSTHTELAGFDELKSVTKGGSYQFVFTKTGSWGYHNHLVPSEGGTIIVQ